MALDELDCFVLPEEVEEVPVACLFIVLDFVFVASGFCGPDPVLWCAFVIVVSFIGIYTAIYVRIIPCQVASYSLICSMI